jgi:hypothetical protein
MVRSTPLLLSVLLAACPPAAPPPRTSARHAAPPAEAPPSRRLQALPCPAGIRHFSGTAPWETQRHTTCIRGPEGRWIAEQNVIDPQQLGRYVVRFDGIDGRRWRSPARSPVGLARRLDGHALLLDGERGATLYSLHGAVVWRTSLPRCGALDSIAIGWDDVTYVACGYQILRIEKDGRLAWEKWPFGNQHVNHLWVDCDGTLYATSRGQVAALRPDGTVRWSVSTGFNRYVHPTAWLPNGRLVLQTSMAEAHSPRGQGRYVFYYEVEPSELLEVTVDGKIERREEVKDARPGSAWPRTMPLPEDGANRVPRPQCLSTIRPLR